MLKGLRHGRGASGLGRIGGFAVARTARRWAELLLLSNAHVLNAHGAGTGDTVYQSHVTMAAGVVHFHPHQTHPIAVVENRGHEGPYRFAYPRETAKDYFIDCATARLLDARASPGGPTLFTTIARAHPLDVLPNRTLTVHLAGRHRHPAARAVSVNANVIRADGRICPNCIVIETLPGQPPFATAGDSGALVVDSNGRAIGLLWGVNLATPTLSYACHIHPVLDCLKLVLSPHYLCLSAQEIKDG